MHVRRWKFIGRVFSTPAHTRPSSKDKYKAIEILLMVTSWWWGERHAIQRGLSFLHWSLQSPTSEKYAKVHRWVSVSVSLRSLEECKQSQWCKSVTNTISICFARIDKCNWDFTPTCSNIWEPTLHSLSGLSSSPPHCVISLFDLWRKIWRNARKRSDSDTFTDFYDHIFISFFILLNTHCTSWFVYRSRVVAVVDGRSATF